MRLLKYTILLLPILIVLDVKIPLTEDVNFGIKDVLFLFMAISLIRKQSLKLLFKNRIFRLWFLFLLFSILSNLILDNMSNAVLMVLRYVEALILGLSVWFFLQKNAVTLLYKSIVIAAVMLSIRILLEYFAGIELEKTLGGVAGILLNFSLLILYFQFKSLSWNNGVKLFLFIFFLFSGFFSGGRTWFLISIALIGVDFIRGMDTKRILLFATLLVGCLLFYSNLMGLIMQNEKMANLVGAYETGTIIQDTSIASRLVRWGNITDDIKNNWMWGVGIDNIDLGLQSWIKTDNPDNMYLQTWLENGLLGLICLFMMLYRGSRIKVKNAMRDQKLLRNYFVLLLLGGMTWGYFTGIGVLLFGILLGITASNKIIYYNLSIKKTKIDGPHPRQLQRV